MPTKHYEYLPYHFTEEEKRELSNQMALSVLQLSEARDKLKTIQKQINSEIQVYDERIKGHSEKIRSGYEMRNMEVTWSPAAIPGMIDIYRVDTGERVNTRAMSEDERQGSLFE